MNTQIEKLVENIERIIVGKRNAVIMVIIAMLSEGHILIEDVPGVGKTRLVSALASYVDGHFNRIQLTPDIMPSDIVGFSMIDPVTKQMKYQQGAAMCNFLLADEINRASPKAQSSLLEIMEEHQISLDGKTMPLPSPFMVLATQNPVETYGTYHLPEAQMDRFMMKLSIGYPTADEEIRLAKNHIEGKTVDEVKSICSSEDILALRKTVNDVYVSDAVLKYIQEIIELTRNENRFVLGASPRAMLFVVAASRAKAFLDGRDFVKPDDVKAVSVNVLHHRLTLTPEAKIRKEDIDSILKSLVIKAKIPME